MAMKKGSLLIIAAAMLLAPLAAYSCPPTTDTAESHDPIHGSMADMPSDKMTDQSMNEMKDMKSGKAVDKPMTDTQQGKMMQSK
jgi:hypothetical protein